MTLPVEKVVTTHGFREYPLLRLNGYAYGNLFLSRTFLRHVRLDKNGCWIWTGCTGFHPNYRYHRYGQLKYWDPSKNKRVSTSAHRYAYVKVYGPIAPELDVDHLCHNKLCVNPCHLEAISHQENIRRSLEKTHCKRGHEFTLSNSYVAKDGKRRCRACYAVRYSQRRSK